MWIVRLALRRPFTVAALVFVIFIFGGLSASRMRVDMLPAIDIPVVVLVWSYPGLSADEMEQRVVFIDERAISTSVSGVTRIESQSQSGIGILRVYFEQGTDIGGAIAQIAAVNSTITRILPPGMTPPTTLRFNASNVPVAQLTVSSESQPEQALFDWSLNFLRVRLFTIPGLALPAPYGGRARQVMVDVDPARCAAKGLSIADVVNAITAENVTLPAGSARIGDTEYDVRLNSQPPSTEAFNDLPIKVVGGQPILMRDVATVHDGYAVQTNIVHVNGRRATYLSMLRKENSSTLAVVDGVRELLPEVRKLAPPGVELRIDFDQSVFVRAAVMGVLREALIAAALVSLMVLFFLGSWRSTVLVATSIPCAILVGVIGLYLAGASLNLMTLGGLALAVGMLVDDATVEVENIHRNRGMGKPLTVAILDGARQIATPAFAATLTICIVFFPVVLLTGPARFLFQPLALSVVISMLASYLLSRTLVPSLARKLLAKEPHHDAAMQQGDAATHQERAATQHPGRWARFNDWRDRRFERLRDRYAHVLELALARRGWVLLGALALTAVTGVLLLVVGLDFFPAVDTGQMRLHFRAPTGTRIEVTEKLVADVEREIRRVVPAHELSTINDNIGVPLSYNLGFVQSDNAGGQDAEILIQLADGHHPTAEHMARLRRELPPRFPGSVFYFQAADLVGQALNFGLAAPLDVQVQSRNGAVAYDVARKLLDEVERIPGTVDVRIPQIVRYPALRVDVDRQSAATVGVTERDVANSLLSSLSSSSLVAPSYWIDPTNQVSYPVVVQTPLREVASLGDVLATSVTPAAPAASAAAPTEPSVGPGGPAQAPQPQLAAPIAPGAPLLGSFSTVHPESDRALISHYTVQPTIDVECAVAGRDLGAVAHDIEAAIARQKLPPGVTVTLRGQSESMFTAFGHLGAGLFLAIALVYLLLVILFQSFVDPFIIMVAVPGALVGILWMLVATGTTLNVESFMGAIMAVGIATSISILLVSFANDVRVERGLDVTRAAVEAGRTRLRPVLMTALAMILGMLPMALGLGEGGEQNAPLGRAVIGGLVVATFVTLFVVPLVYTALRKKEPTAHRLDEQFAAESRGHEGEVRS